MHSHLLMSTVLLGARCTAITLAYTKPLLQQTVSSWQTPAAFHQAAHRHFLTGTMVLGARCEPQRTTTVMRLGSCSTTTPSCSLPPATRITWHAHDAREGPADHSSAMAMRRGEASATKQRRDQLPAAKSAVHDRSMGRVRLQHDQSMPATYVTNKCQHVCGGYVMGVVLAM